MTSHGENGVVVSSIGKGYEYAFDGAKGGESTEKVAIHRLTAVAEHGVEALRGKVVHHESRVEWDNRVSNLTPLTQSEHKKHHIDEARDGAGCAITCVKCDYDWVYGGEMFYATCPNCQHKTPVKPDESTQN